MHNTMYSDDLLPFESLIIIQMIVRSSKGHALTAKVKLIEDSVHTALYQRVPIAALAGKSVTQKISCG